MPQQTPPPPQYHPSSNRSLLEQKLELLEARFTQPLESLRSPFTGNSSTTTINPFTSPFGVNPNNNNNNDNSQHSSSFTFDTPSLSATAFPHSNSVSTTFTDKKPSDNIKPSAFASGVVAAAVAASGGSLQAVEQATARHMQRLAQSTNSALGNMSRSNHDTRSSQAIVVAASDISQNHVLSNNSSSSRSTLVAGNNTRGRNTTRTRQTRLSPILKENDAASNSKKSSKNTTVRI